MMSTRYYDIALAVIGLCIGFSLTDASTDRDLKLCPGPLYYYEELGCTPIFENSTSSCPTRYNCDNWKNLPEDKCLVNGKVYAIGQKLLPGQTDDYCSTVICEGEEFSFMYHDCVSYPSSKPGCYYASETRECCAQIEICEDDPVLCTVDGKPYKNGEKFIPMAEPEKTCFCGEGYDGVNDERFCIWRKPSWCKNVINEILSIRADCAPIYASDSSLHVDCNVGMRCLNIDEDHVVRNQTDNNEQSTPSTQEFDDSDKQCVFGDLTMNIGEELNESRDPRGLSTCICEVPPVPTCRYLKVTN